MSHQKKTEKFDINVFFLQAEWENNLEPLLALLESVHGGVKGRVVDQDGEVLAEAAIKVITPKFLNPIFIPCMEYFDWKVIKTCFFSAATSLIQKANYLYNSVNNQGCWHREGHGDYKSRGILEITYAWHLPY